MNYLFFNSDLVTIMIPKIGNNDIKRYGKIERTKEGSKTPISTSALTYVNFLFL